MKIRVKFIISMLIIGLIGSALTGCALFPKEESVQTLALIEPAKIDYKTIEVLKGNILKEISGRGAIIPSNRYNLCFEKHGGYLKKLIFKVGDKVEKGQVLAILDTEELEYEVLEQELKLQKSQVILNDLIRKKEAQIDVDKASLDVKIEELTLQKLKTSMDNSKLVSPVSGVINYCTTSNIGDLVDAYQIIYTVVNSTDYVVEYENANVSQYKVGMNARIIYNKMSYPGKVVTVQYELTKDDKVHKYPYVTVKFLKKPEEVSLGDFTEFRIELEKKENVLLLSKRGINTSGDSYYVQILENGQVEDRYIETGIENDDEVEVVNGLKEGQKVIEK